MGLTFKQLIITFVIVVIITLIALPALNSYITQGKVSDAIVATTELKNQISSNITKLKTVKGSAAGMTLPASISRYIDSYSISVDGVISISTTENAGGINLVLKPEYNQETEQITWICKVTSSSFNDFVPGQCRV